MLHFSCSYYDVGDELRHCWEMCGKLMRMKYTEMEFYEYTYDCVQGFTPTRK
jgi:hypothetical protein